MNRKQRLMAASAFRALRRTYLEDGFVSIWRVYDARAVRKTLKKWVNRTK